MLSFACKSKFVLEACLESEFSCGLLKLGDRVSTDSVSSVVVVGTGELLLSLCSSPSLKKRGGVGGCGGAVED